METKQDIRRNVLKMRNALTEEQWNRYSDVIAEKLFKHPFYRECDELFCYVDYNKEVRTRSIIEHAWKQGKKVAVPKVLGSEMEFYYIADWKELEPGCKNILEPATQQLANGNNVLVVMPGVVFDQNCNRIGYGKGYYDRYMAKHASYRSLALAFEVQMVPEVPCDKYDIKPEVIITEEKMYV